MGFSGRTQDVMLLIARVGIGAVFVAHGWQKLFTMGMDTTVSMFDQATIPLPTASAWFTGTVELVGGFALIAGALVPLFGVLLAVIMAGAYAFVHSENGFFLSNNGYEYVLALGMGLLALVAAGPGRFSVDHMLLMRFERASGRGIGFRRNVSAAPGS